MRAGQRKKAKWGSYTENEAKQYFAKLGLKCCTEGEYVRWFTLAERAQTKCRTLKSFCNDCTLAYACKQRSAGTCINPGFTPPV